MVLVAGSLLAAGIYGFGQPAGGEVAGLKNEVEALKAGQAVLQKELQEIRDLLRRQPGAPPAPRELVLSLGNAPFKGNANATITLVEFSDYECGFCARHVRETIPLIERDYVASGKVKYVFRNFPVESSHKQAFKAHEAASCAAEQGRFWPMHDRLFGNQGMLTPAHLPAHASALGLDAQRFQRCLAGGSSAVQIRKDMAEGRQAGVTGTPAFFIGVTTPNSPTVKVARTIIGAKPYSAFKEAIDSLLNGPTGG